jgi:hypothetical protein
MTPYGYEPTREATMAAFAKSCDGNKGSVSTLACVAVLLFVAVVMALLSCPLGMSRIPNV